MSEASKRRLHIEVEQEKNLRFPLNVANQEVISAEQEVAHSRRRWSDLVVRSVPIMVYLKNSVTIDVYNRGVVLFRILSQIKAASASGSCREPSWPWSSSWPSGQPKNSSSTIKSESICMCWSCDDEFVFLFQPNSVISMSILYVLTLHHRGDVTDKDG